MRLNKWQMIGYAIASVLYVLEYLFILLTTPPETYNYRILDCIYFQWQCLVYLILFVCIFHSFRNHAKVDRVIIFSALTVSIIRFATQGLESFKVVNAGDIKVVMFNFSLLVLSILVYTFQSQIVLWYKKLR